MQASRRWGRALLPLAWAAGGLLAARIDVVVRLLPVLCLFRGPFGLILAALAVAMAGAAMWGSRSERPAGRMASPSSAALFGVSFLTVASLGLHYTGGLRVSGDEPHYLIMAQSLWNDHDLDLRDNYAREDWREYTPGPIVPPLRRPQERRTAVSRT